MTPSHAYKGYLSGIFTGAVANGRPWVRTWAGQILSVVAMLSGYSRAESMRAMHRALHQALAAQPYFLHATGKAVYAASYTLPSSTCIAIANLQTWLKHWAHWERDKYLSWAPRGYTELRAYEVVWNTD